MENLEAYELLRAFYRRWSTIEITEDAVFVLKEDVFNVRIMLEVYGVPKDALIDAEFQRDRSWFARKFVELTVTS